MEKNQKQKPLEPAWFNGKAINAIGFARAFLGAHPMQCVHDRLYDENGCLADEEVRQMVFAEAEPYLIHGDVGKAVQNLTNALKLRAHAEELPMQADRVHFANGTYCLDGAFSPKKQICRNRLPVNYDLNAPRPGRWLAFLRELLYEEDIPAFQEYLGYLLIPSTRAQQMLLLIGNGGEGKSRIGRVLRAILGDNMNPGALAKFRFCQGGRRSRLENPPGFQPCSIVKLATNRFARADLEGKLLMLDDDMNMSALPDTNTLKSIITMEDKIDIERKDKQSYQGYLYARLIGFGNGSLAALYDKSEGFYRRQLILKVRDKPPDRVDDPYLGDRLIQEAEGIALWCLEGLHRLMRNRFHFTISERTRRNMAELRHIDNNVLDFLESTGYIRFDPAVSATTKELFLAYRRWCEDNVEKPFTERTFSTILRNNEGKWNISYDKNLDAGYGKKARGYHGVQVLFDTIQEP